MPEKCDAHDGDYVMRITRSRGERPVAASCSPRFSVYKFLIISYNEKTFGGRSFLFSVTDLPFVSG